MAVYEKPLSSLGLVLLLHDPDSDSEEMRWGSGVSWHGALFSKACFSSQLFTDYIALQTHS